MERDDTLSTVLRSVRLTSSVHFCFMPTGDWRVEAPEAMGLQSRLLRFVPFHIVARGSCWLRLGDMRMELSQGDVIAFPRASAHQLGVGEAGRLISPLADLPTIRTSGVPTLTYGDAPKVRLMCGFLECEALDFRPIRDALPELLMVRTAEDAAAAWLAAAIAQIVSEVDRPSVGGRTVLERLTEMIFMELLRRAIAGLEQTARGWMAAVAEPRVGACLSRIHAEPMREWTLEELAEVSGTSRSVLADRFQQLLGVSPVEYIRGWRLHLAALRLLDGGRSIAEIAYDAGYGSETAFNRAFKRTYGEPPAAWRKARS